MQNHMQLFGYLQYPRSGALQKFRGDLKNDQIIKLRNILYPV